MHPNHFKKGSAMNPNPSFKTAIFGLGLIGEAWAKNLIADHVPFVCWNRNPKYIPIFEIDAFKAAKEAEVLILVVADPKAVSDVLDQIEPALGPGKCVVQSSTLSRKWTLEFARRVMEKGADFLEAPFTGSKPAAECRKTVFFAGGEPEILEKVRPILELLSQAILYTGKLGTASTVKLAMNLNIALVTQALAESYTFAKQGGISDELYFKALDLNLSKSGIAELKKNKLIQNDFSPQFSLKHMHKDLKLALESVTEELPQAKALNSLYEKGMAQGFGNDDYSGVIRLLK